MRHGFILASFLMLSAAACGGGGGSSVDAAPPDADIPNSGFLPPSMPTHANVNKADVGPADWTCLNTPTTEVPTTTDITLTGALRDFQSNALIKGMTIDAFADIDYNNVLSTSGPTALDGAYSLTLPTGHTHWGYRMYGDSDYRVTFLLNQYYDPATPTHMQDISAISNGIAQALPGIIGLTVTPGTGVLAGAFRDCQDREVSNAVATVASNSCAGVTNCVPQQLAGAVTFYLDPATSFPRPHDVLSSSSANGLFAVFQLPVTASAYIQVWGFTDQADMADGQMTLLGEIHAPVVGDSVITGTVPPVRTN